MLEKTEPTLDPRKFRDPETTLDGSPRAHVALRDLHTLWFNTGTLCNLACANCYIESSPRNDRLVYLSAAEVRTYLDEIAQEGFGTQLIGYTGGEPFMNPEMNAMLGETLERGYEALVLTNAMRPMMRPKVSAELLRLQQAHGERLTMRVSLDHYSPAVHEHERGENSWAPAMAGLHWLVDQGFRVDVAGRMLSGEPEAEVRAGFARVFAREDIPLDAHDPSVLILFPEMDETLDVPEISRGCWGKVGLSPDDVMCASSRMVVKRKGAERPAVVACTLLPYDSRFELGNSLREAQAEVALNHPHCARFCVLGGASCSGGH
ncbi:MAG: radical SAM protein [Halofilum sp. (in: g-proteobacteria)]